MEPTTSAAHILQQSDELDKLTKELEKCRADKEFVWGLWKKLQKNNPDLNAAIEMVVQREKINHQQRLDHLLAYGQEKENEFDKLSEEIQQLNKSLEEEREERNRLQSVNQQLTSELATAVADLSTANSSIPGYQEMEKMYICLKERNNRVETEFGVLQQQFSTQEHIYKEQINEMTDKMRSLALENSSLSSHVLAGETRRRNMQEELNEFGKQLKEVNEECNQRVDATRELDELLSCNRDKLEQREVELERVNRENEDMRSQLKECVVEGERHKLCNNETRSLVKHLGDNLKKKEEDLKNTKSLNELLNNKVMELERENTHLKEHMKELEIFKLNITQMQHCETDTQTTRDLLSLGSDMSSEVVVQLLESKTLEFNQLKISHDRRLARYKELQTAHKLLKDQLSTYAPDSMLSVQKQNDVEERALNERVPVDSTLTITYETHAKVLACYLNAKPCQTLCNHANPIYSIPMPR
ncbi:Centlein isoform X1 [Oopsacas minuta]|uniref:Centlein isoform X1 n=1 Tax=Oopsacas minuta TaxID=111878 RepID=A0AAV7KLC9_9METZ|nr:Centlein isoform X1 [Oopsacas minuta]